MNRLNSKRFYGHPKDDFHQKLWIKLLTKHKTISNVAKVFKLNIRQLYKWKENVSDYPLSALINLSKSVKLPLKLDYIKTSNSHVMKDPKMIFKRSCEFIEFFGHLLHDGGIDNRYGVHYTTNSKTRVYAERFENLVKCCFGEISVERRVEKNKITLYYPVTLGYLITNIFKIPKGSKVKNDIGIPLFIKNSSKEKKWLYIITAYLCDGMKDRIAIASSSKYISNPPQLLKDIKTMLNSVGISSADIKESHIYKTKKGLHRGWILRILDTQERAIFKKYLKKYGDFCN